MQYKSLCINVEGVSDGAVAYALLGLAGFDAATPVFTTSRLSLHHIFFYTKGRALQGVFGYLVRTTDEAERLLMEAERTPEPNYDFIVMNLDKPEGFLEALKFWKEPQPGDEYEIEFETEAPKKEEKED